MDDQTTDRKSGLIKVEWVVLVFAASLIYHLIKHIIDRQYWDAAEDAGGLGFVIYYFWSYFENKCPAP